MKISYNWLREYCKTDLTPAEVAEILTATGLEVEGVEMLDAVPGGLRGVVVGEVVEKTAHPNADRLSVTKVNVGEQELLPIVCGAPNVAAGQKVLVATVGASLHPKGADKPFKIKKAKIRGEESRGMICAEDELGIGTSHDGIMVLPENATVGQPAADFLQLTSDAILEIGLTPNRTDAFCHYGVARDLAAFINQESSAKLTMPDVSGYAANRTDGQFTVEVENAEACPRYAGILIEDIEVKPSPEWLQTRLRNVGLTPKNNVVDITNFVLHELGQPLHAFDADCIAGNKIRVAFCDNETPFETLDGVERKLSDRDLMICDAEKPLCIAGVMGGSNSGVSEKTTRVFLESACFNSTFVRKTAKRHQLSSDASFRFERGVDPNGVITGLKRAAMLISEIAGGEITTDVFDFYPEKVEPVVVQFSPRRCNKLIGAKLTDDAMRNILESLEIAVTASGDEWQLAIPTYRVDVTREADVVEEILRIYGYDRVEVPQKMNASLNVSKGVDKEYLHNLIANLLVSNGFVQMMSNSLSASAALKKLGNAFDPAQSARILNPLSADLDVMRQSNLVHMLEAVELNQNHKNADLKLFEFGNVYRKSPGKGGRPFIEELHLSVLITGKRFAESWDSPDRAVNYYDLRNEIDLILQRLGLASRCKFGASEIDYLAEGQQISVGKKTIGHLGLLKSSVGKKFDVDQPVYYAELNWSAIFKFIGNGVIRFQPMPKYPVVRRDYSLLLDRSVSFADIEKLARKTEKTLLSEVGLFDVYEGESLGANKKSYAVRFMMAADRTLKDEEVDQAMGRIRAALEEKLGATLR